MYAPDTRLQQLPLFLTAEEAATLLDILLVSPTPDGPLQATVLTRVSDLYRLFLREQSVEVKARN